VGLNDVPWANIKHAYGPAVDVPDLISALVSSDVEVRGTAWYELHGNLWHQGTIYEATAYAVPFFLQLLKSEVVPNKHEILIYLARLFLGRSYWDVHKELTSSLQEVTKPQFAETLRTELSWVDATKQAIRTGKKTYLTAPGEGYRIKDCGCLSPRAHRRKRKRGLGGNRRELRIIWNWSGAGFAPVLWALTWARSHQLNHHPLTNQSRRPLQTR